MKRSLFIAVIILALGISGLLAQDTAPAPLFDGERALEHIAAQVEFGPRPVATAASYRAGNVILDTLRALGWEVSEDWHLIDFGPRAELTEAALQTLEDWQPVQVGGAIGAEIAMALGDPAGGSMTYDHVVVPVRNLVASYGDGPTILIGAHYDTRLYSDQDADAANHRQGVLGANDAGSGVGVLLELARVISEGYAPNNEIRLVFFDAEDNGRIEPFTTAFGGFANGYILGSMLYANGLDLATEQIDYMLLVDMVGDTTQSLPIEGYSAQYAPEIAGAIWDVAAELGYEEQFVQEARGPIVDDHVPFLQRGIQAVDIIDLDYAQWHTADDTLENVSADSLERVGRVLEVYLTRSGALTPNAGAGS